METFASRIDSSKIRKEAKSLDDNHVPPPQKKTEKEKLLQIPTTHPHTLLPRLKTCLQNKKKSLKD